MSASTPAPWQYNVPTVFALSDDASVEAILSEIPFFAVGILAFAVVTFFLVLKRLNIPNIYLFSSALLAFTAAVLDLGQVLARGTENTTLTLGSDTSSVQPLIIVREVGFALSFGVRFLFFWTCVAETLFHEDSSSGMHSGSWARWGLLGHILKWTLLALSNLIPILQLLWRIDTGLPKFSPVYDLEATMEIVVSALFIIKILLNISVSPIIPRWRALYRYAAVIVALLISLVIAIGNLLCFAFSETILGRFLQAVELYILILFVMIIAFYDVDPSNGTREPIDSSFKGLPVVIRRGSTFRVDPPAPPMPSMVNVSPSLPSNTSDRPSLNARNSASSRLSLWMAMNANRVASRFRATAESDMERLRTLDELEKGNASARMSPTEEKARESFEDATLERQETVKSMDPVYTNVLYDSPADIDTALASARPFQPSSTQNRASIAESDELDPEREATLKRLSMIGEATPIAPESSGLGPEDLNSRAGDNFLMFTPSPPEVTAPSSLSVNTQPAETDSSDLSMPSMVVSRPGNDSPTPIYGMDGPASSFYPSGRQTNVTASIYSDRSSSGMESLLRQQRELDKSIAQLRLFEPDNSDEQSSSGSKVPSEVPSIFSLSNFPEPPPFVRNATEDSSPTSPAPTVRFAESTISRPLTGETSEAFDVLPPPRMPAADADHRRQLSDMPSTLSTLRSSLDSDIGPGASARSPRFDSQGTQYEITSFIAGPGHAKNSSAGTAVISTAQRSSALPARSLPTPTRREAGAPSPLRTPMLGRTSPTLSSPPSVPTARPSPTAASPALPTQVAQGSPEPSSPLTHNSPTSHFDDDDSVRAPPSAYAPPPVTGRRPAGLPANPRMRPAISAPRPLQPRDSTESGIFERPRPAPLVARQRPART